MSTDTPSLAQILASKRVGLALCARFFGFHAHAGLLLALEERGLRPAIYAGTSAGAVVAALAGAGASPAAIAELLVRVCRADFWDPDPLALLGAGPGPRRAPGLLRGERFLALLRRVLPVSTFEACPTPVRVEALNLSRGALETLAAGDLPLAVLASCAYPGLLRPVSLGGSLYWDGGLVSKAPVSCLQEHCEAILVHWLPSSSLRAPLPRGLLGASGLGLLRSLARGIAVARRETTRLQARAALARGVPVYVVASDLPAGGPTRLHLGSLIVEEARRAAGQTLDAPAAAALLDPEAARLV